MNPESYFIFFSKDGKDVKNLLSAAVVNGTLRVKDTNVGRIRIDGVCVFFTFFFTIF